MRIAILNNPSRPYRSPQHIPAVELGCCAIIYDAVRDVGHAAHLAQGRPWVEIAADASDEQIGKSLRWEALCLDPQSSRSTPQFA